jgi:hypothetical protein
MKIRIDKNGKKLGEISEKDILIFVDDSGIMVDETVVKINPLFKEIYTEGINLFIEKDYSSFRAQKIRKVYELTPSEIITNSSKGRAYGLAKITKNEMSDIKRQVREMSWQDADWM